MTEIPELKLKSDQTDHGMAFAWQDDIIIYTLTRLRREALNEWRDSVLRLANHCDDTGKLYRAVYDFSQVLFGTLTPYMRRISMEIVEQTPATLKGYYAVILPDNVFGHFGRQFIEREVANHSSGLKRQMTRQVFFDREEGLAWLRTVVVR